MEYITFRETILAVLVYTPFHYITDRELEWHCHIFLISDGSGTSVRNQKYMGEFSLNRCYIEREYLVIKSYIEVCKVKAFRFAQGGIVFMYVVSMDANSVTKSSNVTKCDLYK